VVSVGYRKENNIEQQGKAVCEETRKHGLEAEGRKVTSCSTVTVIGNKD
jgi:hypothetical protein